MDNFEALLSGAHFMVIKILLFLMSKRFDIKNDPKSELLSIIFKGT